MSHYKVTPMKTEDYIHLFTPVTECLPDKGQAVLCIDMDNAIHLDFIIVGDARFRCLYTHWLDTSKLTTKERAIELAGKVLVVDITKLYRLLMRIGTVMTIRR